MEIRKFIFTIASRFDPRGFKQAEDAATRLRRSGDQVKESVDGISKAHRKSGDAAEKAAERARQAAIKQEQDFRKVIAAAERKAAREDAAAAKSTRTAIRESQRRTQAYVRASEKSARAEIKAAERAAAATRREAMKAGNARRRELARIDRAIQKANQDELKARERVNKLLIENDKKAARRRAEIARQAGEQRAAARADRRAFAGEVGGAAASTAGTVLAGIGVGVGGLAALGTSVLQAGTSFESLRARLKTVEGSAEGAAGAFKTIQDFTKATPFELEEVTTAYVRLKSLGLDASTESLTSFGNIAAAQGKSIIDFIEAVADASTGEFERLKEFGIKASKQGEQVTFTFKGQQTVVKNTAEDIGAFLRGIGESDFAGAMTDQMATASGQISNLKDSISTFFDTVSQSGALDSFKNLLSVTAAKFAESDGFAQILSDALSSVIDRVAEFVEGITEDDITEALESIRDFAMGVADAFQTATEIFEWFVEKSGSVGDALRNLTLLAIGLVTSMTGPGGIVVAAGLVGAALGGMIANAIADWTGLNDSIAATNASIAESLAAIDKHNKAIAAMEAEMNASQKRIEVIREKGVARREQLRQGMVGGLGAGLVQDLDKEEAGWQAQFSTVGSDKERAAAMDKLLTQEGKVVLQAVEDAAKKRADRAEATARREARKRGDDEDAAGRAARSAAIDANLATRQKAFEKAQATFQQTGSAEAAAEAAAGEVGKVKGAAKGPKGKKSDTFFDFEKEAASAAKKQGETFAERELQRFIAEGMSSKAAIAAAQEAGKKRAEELEQRFLEAGRIFDASADNILDILGLRGPGSVLEGRPPPQTLLITINPEFNFIREFNQTIQSVAGAKALSEVTGEGGQAAVEQGLDEFNARVMSILEAALNLQTSRLLQADGGGRLPSRPVT